MNKYKLLKNHYKRKHTAAALNSHLCNIKIIYFLLKWKLTTLSRLILNFHLILPSNWNHVHVPLCLIFQMMKFGYSYANLCKICIFKVNKKTVSQTKEYWIRDFQLAPRTRERYMPLNLCLFDTKRIIFMHPDLAMCLKTTYFCVVSVRILV